MKYDLVIVGAGLTGATIAALAGKDKRILIIEKDKIGGLCHTYKDHDIMVHTYGPHIFHTNHKSLWDWIQLYCDMIPTHTTQYSYCDEVGYVPFPPNMATYAAFISKEYDVDYSLIRGGDNFESYLLEQMNDAMYVALYKHYAEKMWGMPAYEIPSFIAKRNVIRDTYNPRTFNDRYEGITEEGYTAMICSMINGCEIEYADFLSNREYYESLSELVVYTGSIDEYFGYEYGELPYRSLRINTRHTRDVAGYGIGVLNFPGQDVEFVRAVEHKHLIWSDVKPQTIISTYTPIQWNRECEEPRMYPMPFEANKALYEKYLKLPHKAIFAGRLGTYQYINMDQCIDQAMRIFNEQIKPKL